MHSTTKVSIAAGITGAATRSLAERSTGGGSSLTSASPSSRGAGPPSTPVAQPAAATAASLSRSLRVSPSDSGLDPIRPSSSLCDPCARGHFFRVGGEVSIFLSPAFTHLAAPALDRFRHAAEAAAGVSQLVGHSHRRPGLDAAHDQAARLQVLEPRREHLVAGTPSPLRKLAE